MTSSPDQGMPAGSRISPAWDQIDAAPVINLDDRPERWEAMRQSASKVFPSGQLSRFSASFGQHIPGYGEAPWFRGRETDKRWAARAGCTLSHRKIIERAVDEGWETVMILEDDADFSGVNPDEFDDILEKLFASRDRWDVCYFGYSKATGPAVREEFDIERDVYRVSGCKTTHAYLINKSARDWLFKHLPPEPSIWSWTAKHRIIDRWYASRLSKHLKVIAVSPGIVPQAEGYSDLVMESVNYKEEFPGKVAAAQVCGSPLKFKFSRIPWRLGTYGSLVHDSIRCIRNKIRGF